jgi:CRP-like cAMP-binding protein
MQTAQVPWTCHWGRLGGTVRPSRSLAAEGVFWTCLNPAAPRPVARLFSQDACHACARWRLALRDAVAAPRANFEALAPDGQTAAGIKVRHYTRGQPIVCEGDRAECSYTLVSGRAKTVKRTASGSELILEILHPGDPILAGLVPGPDCPSPLSAIAVERTSCVLVPYPRLLALLERQPSLARALLAGVAERLSALMDRMAELSGGRVATRLARIVLALAAGPRPPAGGEAVIPLSFSRQELAGLAGTTTETCIRLMSGWSARGLLRIERRAIRVLDWNALEAVARQDVLPVPASSAPSQAGG